MSDSLTLTETVRVAAGAVHLDSDLTVPDEARGLVLFAHGSGSSRMSPRNQFVARTLHPRGLATLLFDLLTPEEEAAERVTRHLRFDIDLLTQRLADATTWVQQHPATSRLSIGYFGASTGAAAALRAAAQQPALVRAVVSRGGRPDLAGPALALVRAPTLLIVGGHDTAVLDLNRRALAHLRTVKQLAVVPGATHLFEEPGTLERVARLAGDWLQRYLAPQARRL